MRSRDGVDERAAEAGYGRRGRMLAVPRRSAATGASQAQERKSLAGRRPLTANRLMGRRLRVRSEVSGDRPKLGEWRVVVADAKVGHLACRRVDYQREHRFVGGLAPAGMGAPSAVK
jgi:hypothetical protein